MQKQYLTPMCVYIYIYICMYGKTTSLMNPIGLQTWKTLAISLTDRTKEK